MSNNLSTAVYNFNSFANDINVRVRAGIDAGVRRNIFKKISLPQAQVMTVLLQNSEVKLKDISHKCNTTGANITCVVDNLEKVHLVARQPSKTDRRVINLVLTDEGRKLITSVNQYLDAYLNDKLSKETVALLQSV